MKPDRNSGRARLLARSAIFRSPSFDPDWRKERVMRLNFRLLSLLGFLGCAFGLAFAIVYLQHMRGYEPCPFCIFQRIAMAATGIVFLVGALQDRKSVGEGKSVSVRVDLGGSRIIKKKKPLYTYMH